MHRFPLSLLRRLPGSLVRCAASSIGTVAVEFVLMTFLVSALHFQYLAGFLLATVANLALGFVINRRWSFAARDGAVRRQLLRYLAVTAVGVGMATVLLHLFVQTARMPYQLGWMAAGCVCFGTWTYPMNRCFIFAPSSERGA